MNVMEHWNDGYNEGFSAGKKLCSIQEEFLERQVTILMDQIVDLKKRLCVKVKRARLKSRKKRTK